MQPNEYLIHVNKVNALEFHSRRHDQSADRLLDILYEADEVDSLEETGSQIFDQYLENIGTKSRVMFMEMSENDPITKVLGFSKP